MDLSSQRYGADGDVERSAVSAEVVAQESNDAVREKVNTAEGSDGGAELGAALDTNGLGTEEGVAPETNGVGSSGEMIAASDGSGAAGAEVGADPEANIVGAAEGVAVAAGPQMQQEDVFYCHQCHQLRTGATPACKGKKGKCPLKYCRRCIGNRYNWIADELNKETWECPKCMNRCNCCVCKKNKGEAPTGPMVRPGRKRKGSNVDDTPANKKPLIIAENTDALEYDIDLPSGTLVTCVADIEVHPEDVGTTIQFLEFCRLFGKIFKIREGQPEQTVKEITGGLQLRDVPSVVSDIHINLLSIIDKGKANACEYPTHGDEWIRKVGEYIADSTLGANCLNQGVSGYKILTPSCKLDALNCLCDEALSFEREQRESVAREKIRAATRKEKLLTKRQKDLTKPEGKETASNEETENIISQIKEANAVKQSAMNELEELGCLFKIAPIRLDKGVAYWKLDGYCSNNTNIMRQEFDDENTVKNKDKWFMFTEEEQKVIEDHLAKR